MKHRVIVHMQE